MRLANRLVLPLLIAAAFMFARAPFMIVAAPTEATMGIVQRIFYFHVPSASMTFLAAFVCGLASAIYLFRRSPTADRVAVSAAELAVVFGIIVLVTGPLWARKSWGVWWQWDPRVTSTLVLWMIYVSYLLLRRFGGAGSEVLSAAVGLFGTALVPFVYVSVNYWRTIHPNTNVVPSLPKDMLAPFGWCMLAFFLLFAALLIVRVRLEASRSALEEAYVALED